ncbi:arginine N-methyltransferase 7-like [Homarus americanus]|uniref:Protein arginine N-methyltransferase 7 n=1 Tax=Homarus americanus TaxID=6706 RepID=A0A8J5JPU2_HOMAM|nr:arginine N-methyltransferase 7-like [Homarus americanus]
MVHRLQWWLQPSLLVVPKHTEWPVLKEIKSWSRNIKKQKNLSDLSLSQAHTPHAEICCFSSRIKYFNSRKMSVFTQQLNPITGKLEWGIQPEDYDYKQEVARSAYADMLHDQERNDKYYEGLRRSIADLRKRGQEVHVLDIGTGTGLLSMMAVACGADSAFYPMAECARKGLTANECADKVRLVPKRSTEIEVGPGKDMERRANLLVAEVFDTELIGEGAIDTYRHARDVLLTEDALLVPSEGTVYAQVVSSKMLQRWNHIQPVTRIKQGSKEEEVLVSVPECVQRCPGAAAVHDIQLSQVPQEWFTPMSHPLPVFWFDWSGRQKDIPCDETTRVKFKTLASGDCDAVFMWWDLRMDQDGEVMLSCAPYWAHPDLADKSWKGSSEDIPWRDHWMQAVYYLPQPRTVCEDTTFTLLSAHDEYSLWFNIQKDESEDICEERPVCECGIHIANSRTRLGQLNDPRRLEMYVRVLEKYIKPDSVCLALGDGCLMAVAAAKLGARHVYVTEGSDPNRRVIQEFITTNDVQHNVTILSEDVCDTSVEQMVSPATITFSEPFFSTSLLPWHSLYCWYMRNTCLHLLAPGAIRTPGTVTIWGLPVQYRDLWKIRAPLHQCNGFKMDIFDKLIETACEEADERVEPQPLWEYPAKARGYPIRLLTLDLAAPIPENPMTSADSITLPSPGHVNGMALWADWHMTDEPGDALTTGPVEPVALDQYVSWDVYSRQGVYLFKEPVTVDKMQPHTLHYSVTFQPCDGTMVFDFQMKRQTLNDS